MLDQIIQALRARPELAGWSVRKVSTKGVQVYAVPAAVEARRAVTGERYFVDVLRHTPGADGAMTAGSGNVTLLPGDDIDVALDQAVLMAGLVHNPVYSLPAPAQMPMVPVVDPQLQAEAPALLEAALQQLRTAVTADGRVRLTAAEFFGEEQTTHLCTSRGIDATQTETKLQLEWVFVCREGDDEVEAFVEMTRRRLADLDTEAEVARHAQYAVDRLHASAPPRWNGAVVLRGEALATFLNGGVLHTLASGESKFAKLSSWEIDRPIFKGDVRGDALTIFANRRLPFGTHAGSFDDEGQPAQRVALIQDNVLQTFVADQRYADYLGITPTGAFGDIELPAGATPAAELLQEPYVEVVSFSWFNPDAITGGFSSEIRLGYLVEDGKRAPFKGGSLVGNVLDALSDVRWSSETGFYGDYQGPTTARFAHLIVAGEL